MVCRCTAKVDPGNPTEIALEDGELSVQQGTRCHRAGHEESDRCFNRAPISVSYLGFVEVDLVVYLNNCHESHDTRNNREKSKAKCGHQSELGVSRDL